MGLGAVIGAAQVQTIFDGAKNQAITEAREREEELLAAYHGTVLGVFADVENVLGKINHLEAQETALSD